MGRKQMRKVKIKTETRMSASEWNRMVEKHKRRVNK